MKECLIDVLNAHDTVLHVFPIAAEDQDHALTEAECVQEAIKAATLAHLVPEPEMGRLHGRVHVGRGGQLTPYGDVLEIRRQSQERAEERVRTCAYFLWRQEGCPENRAEEHWHQASAIEGHNALG